MLFRSVNNGRKRTTIRYRPGGVDLPAAWLLPIYGTVGSVRDVKPAVLARIIKIEVCRYGELNDADARSDGFESLPQLQAVLTDIYGPLGHSAVVSIYHFERAS